MSENGHARLGPSNHRWPNCPGSIREEAAYPDVPGEAAIDGTGSHLLLELCLNLIASTGRLDARADEWLDRTIGEGHPERPQGWWVQKDRCDRVQMALDYIRRRREELDIASIETESQSSPGYYTTGRSDWWGTVDITIRGTIRATGEKIIEVIDYKDGQLYVSEVDNPQLIGYAGGKFGIYNYNHQTKKVNPLNDPHQIRMTIIQPKTNPVIRYVDTSGVELWPKVKALAEAAARTDDPNAPLIPGPWCKWCKHGRAGNCTAQTQIAMEGVSLMTTVVDGKTSMIEAIQSGQISPGTMTDQQLAAVLDAAPLITDMIKKVEEEAYKRLESGTPVPGYGIVDGRKSKEWVDEPEVVEKKLKGMRFLKGDIYPAKLVTPAAALQKEGLSDRQKASIEKMIKTVPGSKKVGRVATPEVVTAEQMFNNIPAAPETAKPQSPGLIDFNTIPSFM